MQDENAWRRSGICPNRRSNTCQVNLVSKRSPRKNNTVNWITGADGRVDKMGGGFKQQEK